MGKITLEFESKYEVGDVVIFNRYRDKYGLSIGIIEGYYIDHNCNDTIWYNIRVSSTMVYTYSNEGDISESDIIGKLEGDLKQIVLDKIKVL